ncbi:MAG: diguanylate cyclase [Acetobacteraceae bacterium]|nr:diguanylate cyclase [Acetobacteraceae bacterium]
MPLATDPGPVTTAPPMVREASPSRGSDLPGEPVAQSGTDVLNAALLESRQRWRELVVLTADIAFETDAQGRFVFITPDCPIGWSANLLIGQPAALLLADAAGLPGFDPFRPTERTRGRRAWLRRPDGSPVCLTFSAAPILDDQGRITGARGIGQDITEQDMHEAQLAATLRRSQVVEHILGCMHKEVQAARMMKAALGALVTAMGAEGCVVIDLLGDGVQASFLHQVGVPSAAVIHTAMSLIEASPTELGDTMANDGRWVLVCPAQSSGTQTAALALWGSLGGRPWDADDRMLATSVNSIIRVILQHEAMQRDITEQARTDPLTGLLNRRAFLDEMGRRIERLGREGQPGTILFVDLDSFKALNDQCGHDVGDEALCLVADLLRDTVRPSDLVARLGGDEFALWLDGADDLTAAERAEHLTITAPRMLRELAGGHDIRLGMSIGIATRWPAQREGLDEILQRADQAMYQAKRAGRGQWRAWRAEAPDAAP